MSGTRQQAAVGSQQGRHGTATGSMFAFRKRWDNIDWRALASVDVDRIAHEMDFQALQQNIMNVTFCNIHSEDFYNVDPNFIKLFRLAQLIIEYLLHTQQYLTEQMSVLEQQSQVTQQELKAMKEQVAAGEQKLKAVKQENRKRRKMIEAYQEMMNAGATGLHPCPVCKREFVSAEYLHGHIQRRHPDHPSLHTEPAAKPIDPEEIKGRLLEHLNEQLQASEAHLRAELANKEQQAVEEKIKDFEEWKQQYRDQMKREFHDYKESVFSELRQQQMGREKLEEELQQAKAELDTLKNKRFSYLGHLEGAEEIDLSGRKMEQKMQRMKEHLMEEMQQQMKKQNKAWRKRLQTIADVQQQQLRESQLKVHALELSLQETLTRTTKHQQEHQGDSDVADELRSLQQTVQEHELQLTSQQQHLSELQDGAFTTPPASIPTSPAKQQQQNAEKTDEEDEEEEEEEEEETMSDTTEIDGGSYTPYENRPYITCWFNHTPNQIQTSRKVAEQIMNDALNRRGVNKSVVGFTEEQFSEKMMSLQQQRQAQIQTHYNFMEHRKRLSELVNRQAVNECTSDLMVFPHGEKERAGGGGKKRKRNDTATSVGSAGSGASGKPPVPTTAKQQPTAVTPVKPVQLTTPLSSPIQPPSSTRETVTFSSMETSRQQQQLSRGGGTVKGGSSGDASGGAAGATGGRITEDGLESVSEFSTDDDDDTETESRTGTHSHSSAAVKRTPVQSLTIKQAGEVDDNDDSSLFDSDDSLEKLIAPPASSRAFSTPIKNDASKRQSVAVKAQNLDVVLSGGLDPSKRPVGGVPVLLNPHPPLQQVPSDESDTFSLSESSAAVHPTTQPHTTYDEVISMLPDSENTEGGVKGGGRSHPASQTATSRSILTTVTAADDFDDSDFSDLEVTHLT